MSLIKLLALGLAVPASVAGAQQPPSNDDIVIEGRATPQQQIDTFVRQLTPAPLGTQLGRFLSPVCPRVIGLATGQQDKLVEARIRKVAAYIGAQVAPPKCPVNLYVLVGRDKGEIIDGIRREFPDLVADVPGSALKRMKAADGPVAAWQVVGRVGADGRPLVTMRTADGDSVLLANGVGWASRLGQLTVPQFLGSVVVVEANALNRVDTRQLADYAVMRTLAPTDTIHRTALPVRSIIQLFDPGSSPETAPMSVTRWDVAFLKALYASSNEVVASQQRHEIGKRMAKDLAGPSPEGN